jgi:hypothetical protein
VSRSLSLAIFSAIGLEGICSFPNTSQKAKQIVNLVIVVHGRVPERSLGSDIALN